MVDEITYITQIRCYLIFYITQNI